MLRKKLEELKERYEETIYNLNLKKAQGSLSKLCNLNNTFDETFDGFYDKYKKEEESNQEIEDNLDEQGLQECVSFWTQYVEYLEKEISLEGESEEVFAYVNGA